MKRWASGLLVGFGLILASCTSTTAATTTVTAIPPPSSSSTTSTLPDRCPDAFCVIYTIRPDAEWSDGRPVVADDFAYTLGLYLDPAGPDPGNPGYHLVTGFEVVDDETFLLAMSEEFAAWRTLFETVFPAHAEYDPVHPGPTNGPFVVDSWDEDGIVLNRSPGYAGNDGDVRELRFVVAPGVREMLDGLDSGDYDLISPMPQDWVLDDIAAMSGVSFVLGEGAFWEQITFNHSDPLLAQPWVRQAIVLALDREAILDATIRTLHPGAESLGNTVWPHSSVHHQDHFSPSHNPGQAEQILIDNGCTREGAGPYRCEGRPLSLVWATTTGDPFRNTQLDIAVDALGQIGIEILPWRLAPSELFSTPIFFGDHGVWQMMSFSWKTSADPFLADSMYQCVGDGPHGMGLLNVSRYCDPEVDRLIAATGRIMDPVERADVYNQADRLYLEDLAVIPLYQRASLLVWSSLLEGPTPNPWFTDLWNVDSWTGKSTVVVAVAEQAASLTSPVPTDEAAAMVMSVLYRGAFVVTPDLEFVPSLISGAEVLIRGDG